jgi:hypothetical protein
VSRLAWMGHPLSGDVPGNIARSKRWLQWLLRTFTRVDFAADWILWCEVLDDGDQADRARGLRFDRLMINRLSDYWMVGGAISRGMEVEHEFARLAGCEVVDLTFLGLEPPPVGSVDWWDRVPHAMGRRLAAVLDEDLYHRIEERL